MPLPNSVFATILLSLVFLVNGFASTNLSENDFRYKTNLNITRNKNNLKIGSAKAAVRVRSGSGTSYSTIYIFDENDLFYVSDCDNGWCKVIYLTDNFLSYDNANKEKKVQGKYRFCEGYTSEKYIKIIEDMTLLYIYT